MEETGEHLRTTAGQQVFFPLTNLYWVHLVTGENQFLIRGDKHRLDVIFQLPYDRRHELMTSVLSWNNIVCITTCSMIFTHVMENMFSV